MKISKTSTLNGYCYGYYIFNNISPAGQPKIEHRNDDLPAFVNNHTICWFQHGVLKRDNGLTIIKKLNYDDIWLLQYGIQSNVRSQIHIHRSDGPAVRSVHYNELIEWYIKDDLTIEKPDIKFKEHDFKYYKNSLNITNEVNSWLKGNKISLDHNEWTNAERVLYKLTFG